MLSDRVLTDYCRVCLSARKVKTLKLFFELRFWDVVCDDAGMLCAVLFSYPLLVCCSTARVYAFSWSLIKFPIEGFIIFIRQKRENYRPIHPCVWAGFSLLPLVSFALCVLCRQAFVLPGTPRAHHVSDVERSFVSMLELSCSLLVLSGSSKPPGLLIIIQICEHQRFQGG